MFFAFRYKVTRRRVTKARHAAYGDTRPHKSRTFGDNASAEARAVETCLLAKKDAYLWLANLMIFKSEAVALLYDCLWPFCATDLWPFCTTDLCKNTRKTAVRHLTGKFYRRATAINDFQNHFDTRGRRDLKYEIIFVCGPSVRAL